MSYPYKFIIDTSAMLSQKGDEMFRRSVFRSQWTALDEMVKNEEVVICSEIRDEVQDESIKQWMLECSMKVLPLDAEVQGHVKTVVKTNTELVDFKANKSSGDAFLIATAMKYGLTVITNENKTSPKKIPYTCELLNVPCMNIIEFFESQRFVY